VAAKGKNKVGRKQTNFWHKLFASTLSSLSSRFLVAVATLTSNLNIYIARDGRNSASSRQKLITIHPLRTNERTMRRLLRHLFVRLIIPIPLLLLVSGDRKGRSRGIRGGNDNDMRSRNPPFLHFFPVPAFSDCERPSHERSRGPRERAGEAYHAIPQSSRPG